MRVYILVFLFMFLIFGCKPKSTSVEKKELIEQYVTHKALDIKIDSFDYNGLKPLLYKKDDKTYVVNFWATWCGPCVKELPAFEKLNAKYADKNVEVLLVSLDFPKQIKKQLIPFIKKKNIRSKVVLLNDENEQRYIDAISSKWSGALPATLIYNKNKREFYEQSFNYEELETELQTFLNP